MGGRHGALLEVPGTEGEERLQRAWSPHVPPPQPSTPTPRINSTIADLFSRLVAMHTPGEWEASVSLSPPWREVGRGGSWVRLRLGPHQEQLRLSHTRYLQQHPDAEALVSDFLLFLLLRQPNDVITFAAEFFGPFSARHPRTSPLRSSKRPSPFRSLDWYLR